MRVSSAVCVSLVSLACLFLLGSCASQIASSQPKESLSSSLEQPLITNISTTITPVAQLVTIQSTTPLLYTAFKLSKPLRLVIDFVDATFASSVQPIIVQQGVISVVNPVALEQERIARIEIDLQQETAHKITQQEGQLTVSFTPSVSPVSAASIAYNEEQRNGEAEKQQAQEGTGEQRNRGAGKGIEERELHQEKMKRAGREVSEPRVQEQPLPTPPALIVGKVLPPTEGKASTLQGLQVERGEEFTRVRLFADGKVSAYNANRRATSFQLFVSLPDMSLHLPEQEIAVRSPFLEKVSIQEKEQEPFLAFTFPTQTAYEIYREQNQLVLRFSDSTPPATPLAEQGASTPPPPTELLPPPPQTVQRPSVATEPISVQEKEGKNTYTIKDISLQKLLNKTIIRVETTSRSPRYTAALREDPLRLSLDLENAFLPKEQQRVLDVDPTSGGAVQSIIPLQYPNIDPPAVRIVVRLEEQVPYRVNRKEGTLLLEITDPPQLPTPIGEERVAEREPTEAKPEEPSDSRYTGTRISLDFQQADINDILRLLAEVSGLNIITGGDVSGEVSIRMVNVPWDQALDVILRTHGLGQERIGNIIRVAPLDRLLREQEEQVRVKQAAVNAEEPVTQIIPIKYANAEELQPNLQSLLSERGTINIDQRTNTVIVRDVKDNIQQVFSLVETLDKQTPQVLIEAKIVETTRNFEREFGIQWGGLLSSTTDFRFPHTIGITGGRGVATTGTLPPPPGPPAANAPTTENGAGTFVVNLPASVGPGRGGALGITLGHVNNSALLSIQISALEDSGQARVISSPRVVTLDNSEAKIESGFTIPFETISAEGTRTEFVDANINLTVTPHVTPDDFVIMQIKAARNEPDFANRSAGGAPTIIRREATTNVLVRDGETTVIGGLFQQNLANDLNGIPYLSRIPVLGWLFKRESRRDNNDELLIFITPRVLKERTVEQVPPFNLQ